MSLQHSRYATCMTQSPSDRKNTFSPQATVLRRRLVTGIGSASLVAVGANFAGITSFLLGFSPETGRNLKLDVIYPIGGYSRYIQTNEGFEFIYPAGWVGDQTLLNRALGKLERSLDAPLPTNSVSNERRSRDNVNEPVVAFGPPGSTGELNVSVIVSPVPLDFSLLLFFGSRFGLFLVAKLIRRAFLVFWIEAFGGPKEVGEAVIRSITGSTRKSVVKGTLIQSNLREDPLNNVNYYILEYKVESPSFRRHNMAVCCAKGGRLFTLNAQSPESAWANVKLDFYRITDSFYVTS